MNKSLMKESESEVPRIFLAGEDENIGKIKRILQENHPDVRIINPENGKVMAAVVKSDFDALMVDCSFSLPVSTDDVFSWISLRSIAKGKGALFFLLVNNCVQGNQILSPSDGDALVKPNGSHQVDYVIQKVHNARQI